LDSFYADLKAVGSHQHIDPPTGSWPYYQPVPTRGQRRLSRSSRNLGITRSISGLSSQKAKMKSWRTIMKSFNQNKITIYSLFTLSSWISN